MLKNARSTIIAGGPHAIIWTAFLADFLHSISGPIVLVGHSYGGAVITNAATGDPQVKALVYVDAFAPGQGQTLAQLLPPRPGRAPCPRTWMWSRSRCCRGRRGR